MKQFIVAAAAAAALAVIPASPAVAAKVPPPLGVPGRWSLVINAGGRDMAAWSHALFGDQCFTKGKIGLSPRGYLALTTSGVVNNCAEVASRSTVHPGEVIEAKIRFPLRGNRIVNWPAFWMTTPTWKVWPVDGEIDVAEDWPSVGVCTSYHYSATGVPGFAGEASAQSGCSPFPITPGWHIYSVAWEPQSLKFYYDGHLLMTNTGPYIKDKPLRIVFDNTTGWPGGQGRSTVKVAWTRVWKKKVAGA